MEIEKQIICVILVSMLIAVGCQKSVTGSPKPITVTVKPRIHPVFNTVVTGSPRNRPAVQISILDDGEGPWGILGRAEFFLSVQSSRFPDQTRILLPINIGDFKGCCCRFVQLPFEVQEGEQLIFELLDDDTMTEEQEQLLVNACATTGFCVMQANDLYCPGLGLIAAPAGAALGELLGQIIVEDVAIHGFQCYGGATYIVQPSMPEQPYEANELSIRGTDNYCYATLRLYSPIEALELASSPMFDDEL